MSEEQSPFAIKAETILKTSRILKASIESMMTEIIHLIKTGEMTSRKAALVVKASLRRTDRKTISKGTKSSSNRITDNRNSSGRETTSSMMAITTSSTSHSKTMKPTITTLMQIGIPRTTLTTNGMMHKTKAIIPTATATSTDSVVKTTKTGRGKAAMATTKRTTVMIRASVDENQPNMGIKIQ